MATHTHAHRIKRERDFHTRRISRTVSYGHAHTQSQLCSSYTPIWNAINMTTIPITRSIHHTSSVRHTHTHHVPNRLCRIFTLHVSNWFRSPTRVFHRDRRSRRALTPFSSHVVQAVPAVHFRRCIFTRCVRSNAGPLFVFVLHRWLHVRSRRRRPDCLCGAMSVVVFSVSGDDEDGGNTQGEMMMSLMRLVLGRVSECMYVCMYMCMRMYAYV